MSALEGGPAKSIGERMDAPPLRLIVAEIASSFSIIQQDRREVKHYSA